MTIKQATFELRQVGVTLRKQDGEYRVNVRGASELHAYYTDDLNDAVATGKTFTLRTNVVSLPEFAARINPRQFNFSPKLTALVGAIIGFDYGVRDGRGNHISSISITSDGFIIASCNAFLGSADDLNSNLAIYRNELSQEDRRTFDTFYQSNVKDWRL